MLTEPILVTLLVVESLDKLNIRYFITGSLATATHGVARSTMDVDMLVDLQLEQVNAFERHLEGAFFVDGQMMRKAIRQGRSFNIIHKETVFKVDIFPIKNRPFDQIQLSRRIALSLTGNPNHKAYVSSPEDNILAKLDWYRKGGEVSDRQWGDVINVIKIQGDSLDREYLRKWALQLEVDDLLAKALLEVE